MATDSFRSRLNRGEPVAKWKTPPLPYGRDEAKGENRKSNIEYRTLNFEVRSAKSEVRFTMSG